MKFQSRLEGGKKRDEHDTRTIHSFQLSGEKV